MINAYSEILAYEAHSIEDWELFLNRIELFDVFKDLFIAHPVREPLFTDYYLLSQGIRYIVKTYSKESDAVILGSDWEANKKRIFEQTFLPDNYHDKFVELEDDAVVDTIKKWLAIQDSNVFSQLCMLKDLQQEMRQSANSKILKSSGEIDYDQKFKNAKYVNELKDMIADLEQELIQNNPKLKQAAKEINNVKQKFTIGPETFAK